MKSAVPMMLLSCLTAAWPLPPPHPDVVTVRHQEASLPPHLRSPALANQRLREVLPLTSLLHHGEMPVFNREASNVRRHEIYKMLTHAGFLPRSWSAGHHQQSYPQHWQQLQPPRHEHSYFPSPEQLQYL